VTTNTDCGGCGHSCQGGKCEGEVCQPVTLASSQVEPWAVAVDSTDTYVYWTTNGNFKLANTGGVRKIPIDGGQTTTLWSSAAPDYALFASSQDVYWIENSGTYGIVRWYYPVNITTFASGPASSVAADATNLYWTGEAAFSGPGATNGVVLTKGLTDANGSGTTLASGQDAPLSIAVDSKDVYWTNSGNGTVMKVPKDVDAGVPITLASGQASPQFLAVDPSNAYWTNVDGGTVMKVPLDGGSTVTLASGQFTPEAIAVDPSGVYWTNNGSGTVMGLPLDGGVLATLASTQAGPMGIATDPKCVYWTALGTCPADGGACTGSVMKVAK
jgi:hypothetical protein